MRKLAILLLPVTAALDGLRVTVTSKFASNTTTENSALDRLARAQRLRDDLAVADAPTALGGWTVEVVARSTEYEKLEENDEEVDDEAAAEISVDSPQLELSEKRIRALPYLSLIHI